MATFAVFGGIYYTEVWGGGMGGGLRGGGLEGGGLGGG